MLFRSRGPRRALCSSLHVLALSALLTLSLMSVVTGEDVVAESGHVGETAEKVSKPEVSGDAPEDTEPKQDQVGLEAEKHALEDSSGGMDFTMIAGVLAAVVVGIVSTCFLLGGEKKRVFKGDAVFLLGECDSGKTTLLFHLRDKVKGEALPATNTSMQHNETQVELADEEAAGKVLRIIDFPGHPRLRPLLFDILEDCAAVIFVVDSITFASKAKEIASFMLDLLTSTAMLKHCTSMLVLCNKTDALPDDMAGVSPKIKIKQRLEKEIDTLRKTRAESLDDIGNTLRIELEIAGDAFKWTDAPVDVEFADASVNLAETQAATAFLARLQ